MSEFSRFRHAVRFLTIVPLPAERTLEPDWLPRSAKYFPLVGLLIGAFSAAILVAASQIWNGVIPALLAVASGIALTGAFHEDGLADTADSLGGRSPEARLAIMTDSRIGTYGTLALGLSVALRIAALSILPLPLAVAALIAAHAGGRLAGVITMSMLPYAADREPGKITHPEAAPLKSELLLACALAVAGFAPLISIAWPAGLAGAVAGAVFALAVARLALRLLDGYTGDVLGAAEQMFELGVLLSVAAQGLR